MCLSVLTPFLVAVYFFVYREFSNVVHEGPLYLLYCLVWIVCGFVPVAAVVASFFAAQIRSLLVHPNTAQPLGLYEFSFLDDVMLRCLLQHWSPHQLLSRSSMMSLSEISAHDGSATEGFTVDVARETDCLASFTQFCQAIDRFVVRPADHESSFLPKQ